MSAPLQPAYALCLQLLAVLATERPELVEPLSGILRRLQPRKHGPGFSSVLWDGASYAFSATQAAVVAVLWEAFEAGTPEVKQELLLDQAGSVGKRIQGVFEGHPAWGTLIVRGRAKGTFCLADVPPAAN